MSKECANCGNERLMLCPFCEHDYTDAAELTALRTALDKSRATLTRIDGIVWEPGQEDNREIQILNLRQITRLARGEP